MNRHFIFVLACLLLVACDGGETAVSPPSTSTATATVTSVAVATVAATVPPPSAPTAIPTIEPMATIVATITSAPTATPETAVSGRDATGAFYYGNPNADVVLIDFSDFL